MKFPSLFKVTISTTTPSSAAWRWRSCTTTPKTLSFRAYTTDNLLKTAAETAPDEEIESAVVSGLRSERLFFEPGETNSILEEAKPREGTTPLLDKECVEIQSFHPVLDFRASMEEMVAAHGGRRSWDFLEELLACYLQVNDERNYGYILEAFADLLINHKLENRRNSFTSPLSFTSSSGSPLSLLPEKEDPAAVVWKDGAS
ncbi:hypothetical protein ACS0TY_016385 [Phlomoides rotata]